jgi:hypothetical protein
MPFPLVAIPPSADAVVASFSLRSQLGTFCISLRAVVAVLANRRIDLRFRLLDPVSALRSVIVRVNPRHNADEEQCTENRSGSDRVPAVQDGSASFH